MNQRRPHIPELDGIRAIAVGLVLITHLFGNIAIVPRETIDSLPAPLRLIVTHGWLGVDLFFVLSGFLITGILLDAKGKPGYFRGFYIRRILRIFPLYFTVLVILIGAYGYKEYATYWNCALALSANLGTLFHASVPPSAGPMWSLAVEEQFYFFWPLIVLLLSRRTLSLVAVAIIVIEPLVRYTLGTDHLFYPWARFDGLAIGALIAVCFSDPSWADRHKLQLTSVFAAVSIGTMIAAAPFGGFGEGPLSTALRISEGSLLFGALVGVLVVCTGSRFTAILRSRVARTIADLSFCLYLVHVPIIEAFEFLAHHVFPQLTTMSVPALAIFRALTVLTCALALSALSRQFLELPCMRLRSVFIPIEPRTASRELPLIKRSVP